MDVLKSYRLVVAARGFNLWGHTTQVYYTVCKGNDMVIVNYESQQR
jgi:hypothetical protein